MLQPHLAGEGPAGLRHTRSVINSAAVIMVAVCAGFAPADLPPLEQLGVCSWPSPWCSMRGVLVPAVMAVMGRGNWWWPSRRSVTPGAASRPVLRPASRQLPSASPPEPAPESVTVSASAS